MNKSKENKKFMKNNMWFVYILLLVFSSLISGCSVIDTIKKDFDNNSNQLPEIISTIQKTDISAVQPTAEKTAEIMQSGLIVETVEPTPVIYNIQMWVPPQFNSENNTPGGLILAEIIADYMEQHPNVNIMTRVKATSDESSMVNTITTASYVAENVLPSLAIMSRNDMETCAQRGVLQPIQTSLISEENTWYNYAKQAAVIDETIYGIPIMGDGLVLVYNPAKYESIPGDWKSIFDSGLPIGFSPSSSTQSLFGTFIYLSLGGKITNEQGLPSIDQQKLVDTLNFFQNGSQNGVFPSSITQLVDHSQVWQRFNDGTMSAIVSQISSINRYAAANYSYQALPLQAGTAEYPLIGTWNIVLLEDNPLLQEEVMKFAEYLSDPKVNGKLTSAMGYLPVRNNEQEDWIDNPQYSIVSKICENGILIPENNIINKVLPVINNSVTQVLKNQSTPEEIANEAVFSLN